jgi:DNA-binding transcriptional ArsR family regulator
MEIKNRIDNEYGRFEELNDKLGTLQDLLLKMKVDYDLIARNQIKSDTNSQLIKSTEETLNYFLDHRFLKCEIINQCTTLLQKGVMKILSAFSEKGYYEANLLVNKSINIADSYLDNGMCQDKSCLANAKLTLTSLRDFLEISKEKSISDFKELLKQERKFELFEGNEKNESKLMSVLGNEIRIKILKELTKGSNYYTQLERILGLKGGHFNFHITELKNAKFIETSNKDKLYRITPKGLKALRMLFEISKG